MMPTGILDDLPVLSRLAVAYAPASVRERTLGLLALDARCAAIVRQAREPMLAQMRLAWWREVLEKPASARPAGDPLLGMLAHWEGEEQALSGLVDGWEVLLSGAPFGQAQAGDFVQGRVGAFAGLARLARVDGGMEHVRRAAACWAANDLASGLSDEQERAVALELAQRAMEGRWALPRTMRPLAVLAGLARRGIGRGQRGPGGAGEMIAALRLGMFGR